MRRKDKIKKINAVSGPEEFPFISVGKKMVRKIYYSAYVTDYSKNIFRVFRILRFISRVCKRRVVKQQNIRNKGNIGYIVRGQLDIISLSLT